MKLRNMFGKPFLFDAGSQAHLLATKQADDKLIKIVHPKYGHGWTTMKEDEIIPFITQGNINAYEVLDSYPKKLYFDIDSATPKADDLNRAITLIEEYFGKVEMAISGSQEANKNSYHIVVSSLLIEDEFQLLELRKLVKHISTNEFEAFDWKVYTKNRVMKCIFQSKPERAVQDIILDHHYQNHFICSFFTGNEKVATFKIPEFKNIEYTDMKPLLDQPQLELPKDVKIDNIEMKDLLFLAPINDSLNHQHTWKGCMFARHNGITFDTFWNWAKQKVDTIERKAKWQKYWNDEKMYPLSRQGWINYLKFFYPELFSYVEGQKNDQSFSASNRFTESLNISSVPIEKIQPEYFRTPHRVVIFNVGMGGGKTTTTIQYLKKKEAIGKNWLDVKEKSFVAIGCRIALSNNTYQRMKDEGIDVFNYKHAVSKTRKEQINSATKLMISTESLHYLEDAQTYRDVVVIDEVETVLNSLVSETHKDNIAKNYDTLVKLVQRAKKVLLLDAFTTTKTIDWLKNIGCPTQEIITYSSKYKPSERQIVQLQGYENTIDHICNDLKQGKKLYIFYPYKNSNKYHDSIEQLRDKLQSRTQKKLTVYHGDVDDSQKATLGNVNEEWAKFDAVLTNSAITVGVNYDSSGYDRVYLLIEPYINSSRDIIQTSMRIRSIADNLIFVMFFSNQSPSIMELPTYYEEAPAHYQALVQNIANEKHANFEECLLHLCHKTNFKCDSFYMRKTKDLYENLQFKSKMLIAYDDVPQLSLDEKDTIEVERIWCSQASMVDKLAINRFYFDSRFKTFSEEQRRFIWDNNFTSYFDNKDKPFIQLIKKEANITQLSQLDVSELASKPNIKEYIKKYFMTESVYSLQQIVKCINTSLGYTFITSSQDKSKHTSYEVLDHLAILEQCGVVECLL